MDEIIDRLRNSADWHQKQSCYPGSAQEYHQRECSLLRDAITVIERMQQYKKDIAKIIEDMNNTLDILERCTTSTVLNVEWAKGAYNALAVFKPHLQIMLNNLP